MGGGRKEGTSSIAAEGATPYPYLFLGGEGKEEELESTIPKKRGRGGRGGSMIKAPSFSTSRN